VSLASSSIQTPVSSAFKLTALIAPHLPQFAPPAKRDFTFSTVLANPAPTKTASPVTLMPTAPDAPLDLPFSPITHASNVLETADNATPMPSMSVLSPVTQHRMSFKDSVTHAPSNAKHAHQV
jgi:hypothetical protein